MTGPLPARQRVAAYAIIQRSGDVLLSRLAPRIFPDEMWTLPGGGIDFGEDPRHAVVREVYEETGLAVTVSESVRLDSARRTVAKMWDDGGPADLHSVRLIFEGWVPVDAPPPHVTEEDGSTAEARWIPLADVFADRVPIVPWVRRVLDEHSPMRAQRIAVKALIVDGDRILLARLSPSAVRMSGRWTLPGGGVDHGETPTAALTREILEETGLRAEVGDLLGVHDLHFTGTAPTGRNEDFHTVNLVFAAMVDPAAEPRVTEIDGTTDAVGWISIADIRDGQVPITDAVDFALTLLG